ncbi:hypothetical protein T07_1601 [Trichinella nelsoni]|uniref:Uncharacterized protein n=1 Tax=Trichinella nelsoni TaxID=6336 RepID=A0A0V0SCW5_9BILA|nr:hypothetical protein T07_1601 [Trichinella nelsoni]
MAIFESFLRMLDGGNAVDKETKILLFIDQCPPAHPSDTSYLSECEGSLLSIKLHESPSAA